jgi:hypothetical protein
VGELVGYIERQRDIYRKNVEELLDKVSILWNHLDEIYVWNLLMRRNLSLYLLPYTAFKYLKIQDYCS